MTHPEDASLHILHYNKNAQLVNKDEIDRITETANKNSVVDIVVISFGWNNSRDESLSEYTKFLKYYYKDVVSFRGERLADKNSADRAAAAKSLGEFGPGAEKAIPELIKLLSDKNGAVRAAAAKALVGIGSGAAPALAVTLKDKSPVVRLLAAKALLELSPEINGATGALRRAKNNDKNSEVQELAKKALRKLNLSTKKKPVNKNHSTKKTIIIGIAWDSKSLGVNTFLSDLLLAPNSAELIAIPPDLLLFLFTFWPKALLADNIGREGLRNDVEEIYRNIEKIGKKPPNLFLIGHSFGARLVSALARRTFHLGEGGTQSLLFQTKLKAVILLQPAMNQLLLPSGEIPRDSPYKPIEFPVVVSQTKLDYANGFLYPLANSLFDTNLTGFFESQLPKLSPEILQKIRFDYFRYISPIIGPAFSPYSYSVTALRNIYCRPIDVVFDTVAQIPILKTPIVLVDQFALRSWKRDWGVKHRGLLSIEINESAARRDVDAASVNYGELFVQHSLTDLGKETLTQSGQVFVDISSIYDRSIWRELFVDWIDVIGTHNCIKNREIHALIDQVIINNR